MTINPQNIPTPKPIIRGFKVSSSGCCARCSAIDILILVLLLSDVGGYTIVPVVSALLPDTGVVDLKGLVVFIDDLFFTAAVVDLFVGFTFVVGCVGLVLTVDFIVFVLVEDDVFG